MELLLFHHIRDRIDQERLNSRAIRGVFRDGEISVLLPSSTVEMHSLIDKRDDSGIF